MDKIKVVTSFSAGGYQEYAGRCLNLFNLRWPSTINLHCYCPASIPQYIFNDRIVFHDIEQLSNLRMFKMNFGDHEQYNGYVDNRYQMKFDAIKFAHKVYSLIDGATQDDADVVFWLDADTVTHTNIPEEYIQNLVPQDCYTAYLGREHLKKPMYTECGFVGYRTSGKWSEINKKFMERWQEIYDHGEIFDLTEWHDSFIYDIVRKELNVPGYSWMQDVPESVSQTTHPFLQKFGAYMDHLKGPRKQKGKSGLNEILINTGNKYWT